MCINYAIVNMEQCVSQAVACVAAPCICLVLSCLGAVWYEIYTLSRPGNWITQATRPLLRAFQRKFAADSIAAMQREMLRP